MRRSSLNREKVPEGSLIVELTAGRLSCGMVYVHLAGPAARTASSIFSDEAFFLDLSTALTI